MMVDEDGIAPKDFERLRRVIHTEVGIHLGPEKKTMLEARIKRRLKALGMGSYAEYCDYLFGQGGREKEFVFLVNVVTTNKTDFFREPGHFDFLVKQALPELLRAREEARPLLVWSAGCSTGEEPYTLAMVLSEYGEAHPGFRFQIMATDISTDVLEKAALGVYSEEASAPVPLELRRKYFMHSRNPGDRRVRMVPELRRKIEYRRLNFMDGDYGMAEKADAVFCRNVIIYFDRPTQERILGRLVASLAPGGYLFVGHAENLHNMSLPVEPVAPSLYRRLGHGQ